MHDSLVESKLLPTSSVLGEIVKNRQGEQLGEVKDIVVDLEYGCVAYALLSFGGFLGLGKKLFVVPWNAMTFCDDDGFCIEMERSKLEHAPGFNRDEWPDVSDRRWGAEVHRYYKVTPYWESRNACAPDAKVPKPHGSSRQRQDK